MSDDLSTEEKWACPMFFDVSNTKTTSSFTAFGLQLTGATTASINAKDNH